MKRNSLIKLFTITLIFAISVFFVAIFAGPSILRMYIEVGIGNCQKIPILCRAPSEEVFNSEVNKAYIKELFPCNFPKMSISAPKGFIVVQEMLKKVYYKRGKPQTSNSIIYIDRQEPDFLINLFPRLKKQGIKDDFELMRHIMYAREKDIRTLNDTFFVILKSIFIPDLGDQNNVLMLQIALPDKRGFINYNVSGEEHYFDCNIFNEKGSFFKIYIKDMGAKLDLDKAISIISTATEGPLVKK